MELTRSTASVLMYFREQRTTELLDYAEAEFPGNQMTLDMRLKWAAAALRHANPQIIRGRKWCPTHKGEYQGNYFDPAVRCPLKQTVDNDFRVIGVCDACLDKADGKRTALAVAETNRQTVPLSQLTIPEEGPELEAY